VLASAGSVGGKRGMSSLKLKSSKKDTVNSKPALKSQNLPILLRHIASKCHFVDYKIIFGSAYKSIPERKNI
jgi:hypothetical protein